MVQGGIYVFIVRSLPCPPPTEKRLGFENSSFKAEITQPSSQVDVEEGNGLILFF